MRHGSLFSGIGGFDLAAEWMGWENVFHCEWNPFGQRLLKYYWPNAISYEDICTTDFTVHRGSIDILTGGFPCQPYSHAGKRLGKADERHLFPQMLRAIKEIKPRWVVGENVRGLVSWNGGLVFDEVCAELEGEGYEVIPFLIPAASVNAPHRRDRVWFVAHARTGRDSGNPGEVSREAAQKNGRGTQSGTASGEQIQLPNESDSLFRHAADTNGIGLRGESDGIGNSRFFGKNYKRNDWEAFPTVSPICHGNDGISDRLDGITFSKWRNESIKGGGNAVVPQIPYLIFKAIEAYETQTI